MTDICIVTGTRAEYGLLRLLMKKIKDSTLLNLQVIVTGMHLSPEFGLTVEEIKKDGFKIDRNIEMLLSSDTSIGISKSIGLGVIGFADAFESLKPDLIVLLGDRFEIISAAIVATISRIPIAHIHGGETTQGAFDESIRHSITKMSHLHFVATETYKQRVIQLGENPSNIFLVGGLGIDNILSLTLLSRKQLESRLGFKLARKNLLVTFHPVTLEEKSSKRHFNQLLEALNELKDTKLIFTMPNSDTHGRVIFKLIEKYTKKNENAHCYSSLGQLLYLSCMQHVDGVIGNSSSGLIETPTFKKGTINIGDRQKGRIRASSVIDCEPDKNSILSAIKKLYSKDFQTKLDSVNNPYGKGGSAEAIRDILEAKSFNHLLKKTFYDL